MAQFSQTNVNIFPDQIPGLVGWMDASDISTITLDVDGLSVVSVRNKINPLIPFLGAGTFHPRSGYRNVNGLNTLDFDGESSYMTANGLSSYFTGSDIPFTIFYSCFCDFEMGDSPIQTVWAASSSSSANPFNYGSYTTTQLQLNRSDNTATSVLTTASLSQFQDDINVALFSGTQVSSYINNSTNYTNSSCNVGALTLDVFTLGALLSNGSLSNFWDGGIGEIILYNRALTDAERIYIQRYLGNKWRVSVP